MVVRGANQRVMIIPPTQEYLGLQNTYLPFIILSTDTKGAL